MERPETIDVLGWLGILGWLMGSTYFAYTGDAGCFSRMGAVGTAVAVAYFAMIKHSLPNPVGLHDKLHILNSQLNYQAECTRVALVNSTILALGFRDLLEKTGKPVPESIKTLADVKLLQHAHESGPVPLDEWEAKGAQLVEHSKAADEQVSQVAFRAGKLQALVVVVATLQWGFGDLLFSPVS